MNQSKLEVITGSWRKARENACAWVLVLLLIGWKIGANFLSQSCSVASAKPVTFRHSNENRSIWSKVENSKLNHSSLLFEQSAFLVPELLNVAAHLDDPSSPSHVSVEFISLPVKQVRFSARLVKQSRFISCSHNLHNRRMHWRALWNLSDKWDNSNVLINLDIHLRSFHCLPFPGQTKIKLAPSILRRRYLKKLVSIWKRIKCFPFTLRWRNWKTEQSPVISSLGLCLRKTCAGKSQPRHRIQKAPLSKCFQFTRKWKISVFKFLLF